MNKNLFGFTMIEIMTVVTIISMLASVLYLNFSGVRAEARDEARKNNLKEMQIALALYKSQYGKYPEACNGTDLSGGEGTYACPPGKEYIIGLSPKFIAQLPIENHPIEANAGYVYQTNASSSAYKLMAYKSVEAEEVDSYDHQFARCPGPDGSFCGSNPPQDTYAVYSFGAEDW